MNLILERQNAIFWIEIWTVFGDLFSLKKKKAENYLIASSDGREHGFTFIYVIVLVPWCPLVLSRELLLTHWCGEENV